MRSDTNNHVGRDMSCIINPIASQDCAEMAHPIRRAVVSAIFVRMPCSFLRIMDAVLRIHDGLS